MAVAKAEPNAADTALARLEDRSEASIHTQNIDHLHGRAESSRVTHLYGKIKEARSPCGSGRVLSWGARAIAMGDL